MLLRSASTPILKQHTPGTLTRPVRAPPPSSPSKMISRTSSDSNFRKMVVSASATRNGQLLPVAVEGSAVGGGGGSVGLFDGGGGGGGGKGGDWGKGNGNMDGYYRKMIDLYPDDALLLSNYARFLKEVRGDEIRAEEYCERAILAAKGKDGEVLSMYGGLVWKNHKDSGRAQSYFDQALQSSPHDCYVLASYARFLWDAGEEDEDEDEGEDEKGQKQKRQETSRVPSRTATNPHVTAIS